MDSNPLLDAAAAAAAPPTSAPSQPPVAPKPGDGPGSEGKPPAGQPDPGAQPPPSYRPDGLPEHLAGKDERETLDRVFKAYDGARREMAERGSVPKDADGYTFTPSEKLSAFAGSFEKDELFRGIRADALAHKIPDKQFNGFLNAAFERMLEMELVQKPVDLEAELAKLVPDAAKALDAGQQATARERRIRENVAFVDALDEKVLGKDEKIALQSLLDTAAGNRVVEWIKGIGRETPPALGGGTQEAITPQQLRQRQADPRNQIASPKYDPDFAAETSALYRKHYGS